MESIKYPRIVIEYCASCKWHNRAIWYLQEILQTFGNNDHFIPEVALQPRYDQPGIFQISVCKANDSSEVIYKRRFKKTDEVQTAEYYYDGFPDSKLVKQLVRNKLFVDQTLGHIDKYSSSKEVCINCKLEE